jgi:TATA-box binding protein (TBP) (component of TFIID and TFIIIB)
MDEILSWKINNIKYSFKIKKYSLLAKHCWCQNNNIKSKSKSKKNKAHLNFCVIKDKYTYVIFKSGHINVCKVKSFSEINKSLKHFFELTKIKETNLQTTYTVENICCNGKLASPNDFCLYQFHKILTSTIEKKNPDFYIRFNTHIFPALYITNNNIKGKILVFSSAKFVIVGGDNLQCIQNQMNILNAHMKTFKTIMAKETACA